MKHLLPLTATLAALMCVWLQVGHADDAPSALVSVAPVVQAPLQDQLTVYGQVDVDPAHQHAVASLRNGIVARLMVAAGQSVAKGQPLLALTNAPQAQMAYTQAEAALASARAQYRQSHALFKERLATRADLAMAQQALDSARAAFSALSTQGAGHAVQVLRAPEAATVSRVDVTPGTVVQPGQPLVMLGGQQHRWIRLGVEPEEAVQVHAGMSVALHAVFGTAVVHAKVTQIDSAIDPATHRVDAVVALAGKAAAGLLPGTWMRGTLALSTNHTLAVPRSAVLSDDRGAYLFVVRQGHAHRVAVTTGLESAGLIGVAGVLHAGDTVVTQGNYELHDGMAVRLAVEPAQ